MKQLNKICTLLVSLFISQYDLALPRDKTKPIKIQTDQAYFDQKTEQATYSGNVLVTQGSIKIQAQYLKITTDPKTHKFSELIVTGNPAKFSQHIDLQNNMMISQGDKIIYKTTQSKIEIFGHGYLNHMNDKLTADHIIYNINNGTFNASKKGSNRVSIKLQPQNKKTQLESLPASEKKEK